MEGARKAELVALGSGPRPHPHPEMRILPQNCTKASTHQTQAAAQMSYAVGTGQAVRGIALCQVRLRDRWILG